MHTQRLNYRTMAVLALAATLLTVLVLAFSLLPTARAEILSNGIANEQISQEGLTAGGGIDDGFIDADDYALAEDGTYAVFAANPPDDPTRAELFSVLLPNGDPVKLSPDTITNNGGVTIFKVAESAGVDRVVFAAGTINQSLLDLYSVPVDGSAPAIQLNANITDKSGNGIFSPNERDAFEISPDGSKVVFVQDRTTGTHLYSIDIDDASTPEALFTPTSGDEAIIGYDLTNSAVVYAIDSDSTSDDPADNTIYSNAIGGGAEQELISTAPTSTTIQSDIQIAPNGNEVYYRADFETDDRADINLYSSTIGSQAAPNRINNDPTYTTVVTEGFKFDSASNVYYIADGDTEDLNQLYDASANLISQSGEATPNPITAASVGAEVFIIDSSDVVYHISGGDLYLGANQLVDATSRGNNDADIFNFLLAPDESYIVFTGDLDEDGVSELYRYDISTTNVTLIGATTGGETIADYGISPNSEFVVYTERNSDNLFRISEKGTGPRVQLNGDLVSGGAVDTFLISENTLNRWVIYNADQDVAGEQELFISYDAPDLEISKSSGRTEIVRGNEITYTIEYANTAIEGDALNVFITDTIPSALTSLEFGSVPFIGEPNESGNDYGWDIGTLAAGSSGTIIITGTVDANSTETSLVNEVSISTSLEEDPADNTASNTVSVQEAGPDVLNDSYTTDEDTAVSGDVTDNDTASAGDISVTLDTDVTSGTLVLESTGVFTYTPDDDFYGTDSFIYTATDDNGSANGTATITVAPINDAPTIDPVGPQDGLSLATGTPSGPIALTGITSGAANETQVLTVTASSDNQLLIPDSNITVDYTSADETGTLAFTPTAVLTGTVTIDVTVSDGELETTETLVVDIRDAGPGSIKFQTTPITEAVVTELYTYNIRVSTVGVTDTLVIDSATTLPDWLTLEQNSTDPLSATLSGTPTANELGQTFPIELTASDDNGNTGSQNFSIEVVAQGGDATLVATLTSSPASVEQNDTLTYTVEIENTSLSDAEAVTATLTLDADTTYQTGSAASDDPWTFDDSTPGTIVATLPTLGAGELTNFTVSVSIDGASGTEITANVNVEAANSQGDTGENTVTVGGGGPVDDGNTYLPLILN